MRSDRAFTLIEILVVLTIVAVLLGLVATKVGAFLSKGEEQETKARLAQLATLLEQYRNSSAGDYPPSRLADFGVKGRNTVNEGSEALVLAFYDKKYDGTGGDTIEKWLQDLEGDTADVNITRNDTSALLELVDGWDNPIIYMRREDYSREQQYEFRNTATGESVVVPVKAEKNPDTGSFYAKESYQLRSVGPDGIYDTDDDIRSYRD